MEASQAMPVNRREHVDFAERSGGSQDLTWTSLLAPFLPCEGENAPCPMCHEAAPSSWLLALQKGSKSADFPAGGEVASALPLGSQGQITLFSLAWASHLSLGSEDGPSENPGDGRESV